MDVKPRSFPLLFLRRGRSEAGEVVTARRKSNDLSMPPELAIFAFW
jgi:hypothetical protein